MVALKELAIETAFQGYNLTARRLPKWTSLPSRPFAALNAYFDAVWVLTIPRSAGRREFMSRQLEGLEFEFFTGVDGSILGSDPRVDLPAALARYGRPVRINELACTLSHLVMFQSMLDSGLSASSSSKTTPSSCGATPPGSPTVWSACPWIGSSSTWATATESCAASSGSSRSSWGARGILPRSSRAPWGGASGRPRATTTPTPTPSPPRGPGSSWKEPTLCSTRPTAGSSTK